MTMWSRADIEKLITLVEQRPCLYNVQSLEYLNRTKKAKMYQDITDDLRKSMPGVTLENVKAKWMVLRSQYMREMRAVKASKKSGASPCDIYVPKLWCSGHLSFLVSHVKQRPSEDNNVPSVCQTLPPEDLNESCETNIIETETETCDESSSSKTPAKRRKTSRVFEDMSTHLGNFSQIMANRAKKNDFKWLGDLVVSLIGKISPSNQHNAALKVHEFMTKLVADDVKEQESASTSTSEGLDIIQLSMDGLFDDVDFV